MSFVFCFFFFLNMKHFLLGMNVENPEFLYSLTLDHIGACKTTLSL